MVIRFFPWQRCEHKEDVNVVGAYASQVFAQAIVRAIKTAQPAGGLPAYSAIQQENI